MIIGIPREIKPGENRVAMTPGNIQVWKQKGVDFLVESGAGIAAGFMDDQYEAVGATVRNDRASIFAEADIIMQVQSFGANDVNGDDDLASIKAGQLIAGMMDPLGGPAISQKLAGTNATAVAMELVPRISRAQSMDVLSSMATLAGYKAVLLGASHSPLIVPMLMTAAGTLNPMRVLIMGAGVAGLQACATAKRLGGVVEAYDVRPAAREQIISVGAKPIELDLETDTSEDTGGYAKEQSEEFLARQQELLTQVLEEQDLVITTAAVPGAKSPILVTTAMVERMKPGAVIVDLAAERGGNCELTQLGETVVAHGVTILGPENLASTIATHASQMYGKNMEVLLGHLLDEDNNLKLDFEDEIIHETVIAHGGDVPHTRMRELVGLPALPEPETQEPESEEASGETS
ncbi:MAG TPA: NAD(P)(+) transhydrogenase (Re/Si-specific) subunit alpha [Porticoccaceae bacterium]|nr:NAD(P)(+) transhydrogenase (Re/Si-specific) subunit alpha [Porticoccaceae bacterium]HCO58892.1 NAD(P)(+) transhydrogenase (Re/Si-specific) subunit alpha [Porticoccaceae bacterium]